MLSPIDNIQHSLQGAVLGFYMKCDILMNSYRHGGEINQTLMRHWCVSHIPIHSRPRRVSEGGFSPVTISQTRPPRQLGV